MRRTATALIVASMLVLTGCSSGEDPEPEGSASASATSTTNPADVAALEAVVVSGGEDGTEPTLELDTPFTVTGPVSRVITEGDGDPLKLGQLVSINLVAVTGSDGASAGTTFGGTPERIVLAEGTLVSGLLDALVGTPVGTRLLYAAPGTSDTLIWAMDIVEATEIGERAEGTAVDPDPDLPKVTLADDGQPSLTPVETDPPTELVVQPLIEGSGSEVPEGGEVVVQYTGWLWNGTEFDSSWGSAPLSTALSSVIAGWQQGLAGQKVGSQVMLVVPPDLGYGDQDTSTIPGGSTLVFVVDILAAY